MIGTNSLHQPEDNESSVFADRIYFRPIGPADSVASIRNWFEKCKSSHTTCAGANFGVAAMPTRLVDVGEEGKAPRLIATAGSVSQYLALSHRWGGACIIQTTRANLEKHKQIIPLEDLCATFRDAIAITKKLGYQFIWIDSLCIIQDSPADWEREAACMATIYQNATLTLAAACATSGDTGLFQPRNPPSAVSMSDGGQGQTTTYVLQKPHGRSFKDEVVDGPLNTRAWCLQERHLSRRTVHFGHTQLFWECQTTVWEEWSRATCSAYDRFSGNLTDGFIKHLSTFPWNKGPTPAQRRDVADEYSTWYSLVSRYSRRAMTVADDKLPAISGLASVFASYRHDTYAAGLWQRDLPIGLLWCADRGQKLTSPAKYRAPSWSWAARDGSTESTYSWDGSIEIEDVAPVIETAGPDPYGRVISGLLGLRGALEKINLGRALGQTESNFSWPPANVQLLDNGGKLVGNGALDNSDEVEDSIQIFCLMVFRVEVGFRPFALDRLQQRGDWAWCLLLKPICDQKYARVGLAQVHQAVFSGEKSLITIM